MKAMVFSAPGSVRVANEDAVLGAQIHTNAQMIESVAEELETSHGLVAVADGMGGGPGGAEAAEIVLRSLLELATCPPSADRASSILEASLAQARRIMSELASDDISLRGMGSTVAGIWFGEWQAIIFNCGDSRVYRVRHGYLDQLSKDHSLVYTLYASGEIDEDEMASHPLKHIVTSSVQDGQAELQIFQRQVPIAPEDVFLICSDGVWEALERDTIEACFALDTPEQAAVELSQKLLRGETHDNISFVLLICATPETA